MEELPIKILERIQKEEIKPAPRWVFTARETLFWSLVGLCFLFGAFILVTDIYMLQDIGIDVILDSHPAAWNNIVILVSSAWLLVVLALLLGIYIYQSRTERGYRSSRRLVLPLSASMVILLSTLIYATGYRHVGHQYISSYVPAYRVWHEDNKRVYWMRPEAGLLTGTFTTAPSGTLLLLIDRVGRQWSVEFSSNTVWEDGVNSATGNPVRLIGRASEGGLFTARIVRPYSLIAE